MDRRQKIGHSEKFIDDPKNGLAIQKNELSIKKVDWRSKIGLIIPYYCAYLMDSYLSYQEIQFVFYEVEQSLVIRDLLSISSTFYERIFCTKVFFLT